jgi:hypothetical protein
MTHFGRLVRGASSLDAVTIPGVVNPATGAFRQPAWCSRALRVFPQFDDVAGATVGARRLAFQLAPCFRADESRGEYLLRRLRLQYVKLDGRTISAYRWKPCYDFSFL